MGTIVRFGGHEIPPKYIAFFSASVTCTGVILISLVSIMKHLRTPQATPATAYTIRILLMVPLYSLVALLALIERLDKANDVLEFARKGYECIVLLSFAQLLIWHLGGVREICQTLTNEQCQHIPPVAWLIKCDSWAVPLCFVRRTLLGVIQYVPVSLLVSFTGIVSFCKPAFFEEIKTACIGIIVVSQAVALYCLIIFYLANQEKLAPVKPVMKLVCIKVLVFVTAWQAQILGYMGKVHFFKRFADTTSGWSEAIIAKAILNLLLIAEMFLLAVAHHVVYPTREAGQPCTGHDVTRTELSDATPSASAASRSAIVRATQVASSPLVGQGPRLSCCVLMQRFIHVLNVADVLTLYCEVRADTAAA
eukprot:TRINITY_DN26966_c0_g1_i1.p1 TRINITY_DN26966_c0_g1~~TRINITY_DN26966_c0_g1_i1.p1  ORF type:complete len:365 (+),score=30.49 TRINITY_DN26966_c0_g1_i1:59-1153(+)